MVVLDRLREKSFFFFRRFAKERQKECQALLLAEPATSTAWNREGKDFGNILARRGVSGICRRQIALLAHAGLSDRLALGRARVRQLLHIPV